MRNGINCACGTFYDERGCGGFYHEIPYFLPPLVIADPSHGKIDLCDYWCGQEVEVVLFFHLSDFILFV
ncbi:MAG: hypothetical protein LBH02_01060 [Methanocalculaceae archaeon]|nr:hypothetical protein [Methanocalculaceae archaeon]